MCEKLYPDKVPEVLMGGSKLSNFFATAIYHKNSFPPMRIAVNFFHAAETKISFSSKEPAIQVS